ncbi:unnamed protein product [Adineta steineri]|uniref:Uncharacterized protein n=1 Tax=Adineta steineri TaxID=433720 RepID=A0A814QF13_9BILA|nr:unnamed protein product [Adineta steineri]CAF3693656.1 unnamed protein product [Adineta steineri]
MNLENLTLVWYDNSTNNNEQMNERQMQEIKLRSAVNFLQRFPRIDECQAYIREINKEKIILIITGIDLAEKLLPNVHDYANLADIYIIVSSIKNINTTKLKTKYNKIKSFISNIDDLIPLLSTTKTKSDADEKIAISIFNSDRSTKDLSSENGDFLHLQLLLEILVRMRSDDVKTSLDEFVNVARKQYEGNSVKLEELDNLKKVYTAEEAVWWYTHELLPLYMILNKALRQQNIDILFALRFWIGDMSRQLTQLKREQFKKGEHLLLYRGQIMSKEELNQLKVSIGHIVSMNSFLSTSPGRKQAYSFTKSKIIDASSEVRVLFEIEADTNREDTRPFANIKLCSEFPTEDEVLFMAGSVFRLEDIGVEKDNKEVMYIIKLTLCGDNDNQLRDVFTWMKEEVGQETSLLSLGNILQDLGQLDRAAHFYRCLAAQLSPSSFNVAVCYYSLSNIAYSRGNYDEALYYYQYLLKELPCSNQLIRYQRHFVGLVYTGMGAVYDVKNELDNAVKSYQQALGLLEQKDGLEAATVFANLGNVYRKQKKLSLALDQQQTCLKIYSRLLPDGHSSIASTYENIAQIYLNQREYEQALNWLQRALTMQLACLPANHLELADTYFDFGQLYECTNKFNDAADYYARSLKIREISLPTNHNDRVETEKCLHRVNNLLSKK